MLRGARRDRNVALVGAALDGTKRDNGRAMLRSLVASSVLLGSIAIAHAQESPPSMLPGVNQPEPEKPLRASVTFSPIHLVLPVAELAVEVAVAPKIGVAVVGGVGTVTPTNSDESVFVYEVGVSPRYYVVGNFRQGVQLGAEVMYAHASADSNFMGTVAAEGLAISPYVGYKWVASMGLTLEAQLGASYFAMRGDGVDEDDSRFSALLNLQVGWSF